MAKETTKERTVSTPATVEPGVKGSGGAEPLQLLSTAAVAALLGIRPQSLRAMRLRGTGPVYVRIGGPRGRACYTAESVLAWTRDRSYRSTSEETEARSEKEKP